MFERNIRLCFVLPREGFALSWIYRLMIREAILINANRLLDMHSYLMIAQFHGVPRSNLV